MLEVSAVLYQLQYHILLKREALLIHFIDDKLFEAVFSKVLSSHKVKELIGHFRFAVQSNDF